jgi:hypothetical protein
LATQEGKQGGHQMKRLVQRFGKYNVATFIVMSVGVILFLLTPLLLWLLEFDSDIFGLFVFLIGLLMYIGGLIIRLLKRRSKNR